MHTKNRLVHSLAAGLLLVASGLFVAPASAAQGVNAATARVSTNQYRAKALSRAKVPPGGPVVLNPQPLPPKFPFPVWRR
jgi:hypothetical protein